VSAAHRRRVQKKRKIEEIKAAAWVVFKRNGFDNAKLSEVASECGCGLSSMYYYFKDKRQLVYMLMTDFKNEVNSQLMDVLKTEQVTYQDFLKSYIEIYLSDIEKFKFFVIADSYYNYHMQYDLSDPVIDHYDKQTRQDGHMILSILSGEPGVSNTRRFDELNVCFAMVLGYLRRLVLLPRFEWPEDEEFRSRTFSNLEMLSGAMIRQIGIDPDEVIGFPGGTI